MAERANTESNSTHVPINCVGTNTGSSSAQTQFNQLSDDPLFVSSSENFSAPLVSSLLTGMENYINWRRSMEMVLGIKSKLVFVQGRIPKPTDPYELSKWEKCNKVVLSWIVNSVSEKIRAGIIHCNDCMEAWSILQMRFSGVNNGARLQQLHKEIVTLMQGEMSVTEYHGRLLQLWAEEESLEQCELCDLGMNCKSTVAMEKKRENFKFNQFMTGLNDNYAGVRTQIISSRPRPTLDEAYYIVLEDEMTKQLNRPAVIEASAMNVSHNVQGSQKSGQKNSNSGNNGNKSKKFCTHCQFPGHTKEECYKIHGYPPWHKNYRGGNNNSHYRTGNNNNNQYRRSVNNIVSGEAGNNQNSGCREVEINDSNNENQQLGPLKLNHEQMNKLMTLLNISANENDHMAGMTCLASVTIDQTKWIIDSGATDHITPHKHLLKNIRKLESPQLVLMPNGNSATVVHIGDCDINKHITLYGVLLVPNIKFNLISVHKLLNDSDFIMEFTDKKCYIQDQARQNTIWIGKQIQGLYHLETSPQKECLMTRSKENQATLWHKRLGHFPYHRISSSLMEYFPSMNFQNVPHCEICRLARQCRLPFHDSTSISTSIFQLIHVDIWGPYKVPTSTGAKYFLTIVEDMSKSTWTILMKNKSECADHIIQFYQMVKTQFGQKIKMLRSDNGAEFLSNKLTQFLLSQGCIHQKTCTYSPQQNGVVERKHKHLLEVARALRFQSDMPEFFWGDAILTATYIINRLPSVKLNNKSPYEVLHGSPPELKHIRTFGCLCYATNICPDKTKFDARAKVCVFLGYPYGQKGYKLFDLSTHGTLVSRDVIFYEDIFPFTKIKEMQHDKGSTLVFPYYPNVVPDFTEKFYEAQRNFQPDETAVQPSRVSPLNENQVSTSSSNSADNSETLSPQMIPEPMLRKSTRPHIPPQRYKDYVCNSTEKCTPYPISNYVDYKGCSPKFQHLAMQIISEVEPTSFAQASKDQNWIKAMQAEISALEENNTWSIVNLPQGKNTVGCKWVYKIKRKSDGSIERYKARLVAKGFTQVEGLDYHDTFAPVVKMNTVRTLLAVATSRNWPLYQLDVNNAFLHGELDEEVYMCLPTGFYKNEKAHRKVCRLNKSLYGLKQASKQWFEKFSKSLIDFGFSESMNDYSLFTYTNNEGFIALLVYVDDVIITGTSDKLITQVKNFIHSRFKIKDLGLLHYFLGIEVARSDKGLFINQRKYAMDLISEAGLLGCKPATTPMDTKQKLGLSTSDLLTDPTPYRRLVGQLIYLTVTRPDLAFPVHVLSQFISNPREDHMQAAMRLLRYLKSAPAQGLLYPANLPLVLTAFCDSDWASCPVTRRSVTGYAIQLGPALITWRTKKQTVVSRSSAEAEYRAMAGVSSEMVWLTRLLQDLQVTVPTPISLYCDNDAAIHIARNPVFHERTKHIEIDCHYVRQHVATGFIHPQFVPSAAQLADLFTKALTANQIENLSFKLGVSNILHTLSLRGGEEPDASKTAAGSEFESKSNGGK